MASTVSTSITDLPQRTWRQWWRELPGYWRIGTWALLLLMAANLAVALRVYIGLHESSVIQDLRSRGANIEYEWELNPMQHRWVLGEHRWIMEGWLGKSP